MHSPTDAPWNEGVIEKLRKWVDGEEAVRAALLTSNRAGPPGSYDALSDFDVKARQVGQASELPAGLDVGYSVIADKDDLTTGFRAPSFMAFAPTRPRAADFARIVEEFYSDAPSVAKHLMRGDLMAAKHDLDHDMKQVYLRRLLEWQVALDTDWNVPFRSHGKGLKRRISGERWQQLEAGYAGSSIEDNWRALDATLALFREVGEDVANRLGFVYPAELHRRVCRFLGRYRREGESIVGDSTDR